MLLKTRHFGEIDINEKGIIFFKEGLPGFKNCRKYVLLGTEDTDSPFKWLQSVEDGDLAFAIVNPFEIKPDYDINLSDKNASELGIESPSDALVFAIVVIPEDVSKSTMNLKAPVIINIKKRKGAQIVLDTGRYGVRHYIMEELRKQEVAGNVGSDKEERAVCCNK